ncbi:MAG: NAD(+) synthase, partial [Clostridia bacterium]|nr:NAD(+) synthase [Clostridia bacterium]
MYHGFIKLAAAQPELLVAAPTKNVPAHTALIDEAYEAGVHVLAFPELSLTGATCGDLFLTDSLIKNTLTALEQIKNHTAGKKMLTFVGAPLKILGKLYNCAVAISDGRIRGVMPKSTLPNWGDSYEMRWFTPFADDQYATVDIAGDHILCRAIDMFRCEEQDNLVVGCVIGDSDAAGQLAEKG